MTFGSLFSGIGGMDLGLERAGMRCVWQVEIDPYCQKVLQKHWPHVRRWDDVRTFPPKEGDWGCDLIAGGFPCQDISSAGKKAGIEGERSGLWREFFRILCLFRPQYALIENVSALTIRGMGRVFRDLASVGFDAEWSMLPACSLAASHTRQRLFIVAYSDSIGLQRCGTKQQEAKGQELSSLCVPPERRWPQQLSSPVFCRGADGLSHRVDRLRGLGNAVVPQVAEWIGRRIMEEEKQA